MGEHDAFGRSGRARCEEQKCRVLTLAARHLCLQEIALLRGELPALLQQRVVADKLRLLVVAHAAVLVVDDASNRRAQRQDRQQLVDLLLVLGKDVGDVRTLDRCRDLVGSCILIERHHDGAETLRRAHRRIEPWPIVAQKSDVRAALQAARRCCGRNRSRLVGKLAPGHRAPDATALLADGRTLAALLGVMQQQLGKSVQPRIPNRHLRSPQCLRDCPGARSASEASTDCRNDVANAAIWCRDVALSLPM